VCCVLLSFPDKNRQTRVKIFSEVLQEFIYIFKNSDKKKESLKRFFCMKISMKDTSLKYFVCSFQLFFVRQIFFFQKSNRIKSVSYCHFDFILATQFFLFFFLFFKEADSRVLFSCDRLTTIIPLRSDHLSILFWPI
jgi:hypothetical protein